jgi:hypothetical protein
MAAALSIFLLGLTSALAMDRVADAKADPDTAGSLPCPSRFDYVVLASLADAPSLLSLSTYDFQTEAPGLGRRTRSDQSEVRGAVLVPDNVSAAGDHNGGAGEQACRR